MKILLNLAAVRQGGQLTRATEFVNNFIKTTDENDILVILIPSQVTFDINLNKSVKLIRVSLPFGINHWMSRILWENTYQLLLIKSLNPDVYLSFSHYLPIIKLKIPTIVAVSNLAPFSLNAFNKEKFFGKLRLLLLYFSIKKTANISSYVIALSNECKKLLIKNGIDEKKISIISNGVRQINMESSINNEFSQRSSKEKYILYVSHFYRYKNFEQLIFAYSYLPQSIKRNFRLKLVGNFSDKKYVKELISLSNKLNISREIDFIPGLKSNDLDNLYRSASVFIFPSIIENCPNILLEAMAHRLPILAINLSPIPEFAGSAVEYFEHNNPSQLATKIETCLQSTELLKKMRVKSFERSKMYSWENFTSKVIDLCHNAKDVSNSHIIS